MFAQVTNTWNFSLWSASAACIITSVIDWLIHSFQQQSNPSRVILYQGVWNRLHFMFIFMLHIRSLRSFGWFFVFYGISTFIRYLMPNPVYIYLYTNSMYVIFLNEPELISLYTEKWLHVRKRIISIRLKNGILTSIRVLEWTRE